MFPTLYQFPTAAGYPSHHGIEIATVWSKQIAAKFWDRTVLSSITTGKYTGEIKGKGDNLVIRKEPDYQIRDYDIGQALVYEIPQGTEVVLPIDQGVYWGIQADDVDMDQMDLDWSPIWTGGCAKQLKKVLDQKILAWLPTKVSAVTQGVTAGYSGTVNLGAATAALEITKVNAPDVIVQTGQVLDESNCPDEGRFIIIPPAFATRLKTSELKAVQISGDRVSMMRNGFLGNFDKYEVYVSNLLSHAIDTGADCYNCLFGWKEATAFAGTIDKMETLRAQTFFGNLIRGLYVFGRQVINPDLIGRLYVKFG